MTVKSKNDPFGLSKAESCLIEMRLSRNAWNKHEEVIKTLLPKSEIDRVCSLEEMEDDTFKITYHFFIRYFGNVVRKLEAVNQLCDDPEIVVGVSCDLLEEGKCLIYEVLRKLEKLIQIIKDREK